MPNLITYIEDLVFWISTGVILIFEIYILNSGVVRLYQVMAIFFGILIYFISISRYIFKGIKSLKKSKATKKAIKDN